MMSGKLWILPLVKLDTHVTSDPRRASAWSAVVETIFASESTLASRDEEW